MRACILLVCLVASSAFAAAQGTAADYERANGLGARWRGLLEEFTPRYRWTQGREFLYYQRDLASGEREFIVVDTSTGGREDAFDRAALARALEAQLGRVLDPERLEVDLIRVDLDDEGRRKSVYLALGPRAWTLFHATNELVPLERHDNELSPLMHDAAPEDGGPATRLTFHNRLEEPVRVLWIPERGEARPYFELAPGEQRTQPTFVGHLWRVETLTNDAVGLFRAEPAMGAIAAVTGLSRNYATPQPEPDAATRTSTFVRDHQLWLRVGGELAQLTTDGTPDERYRQPVRSPDDRRVLVLRTEDVAERELALVESTPREELQPKLQRHAYAKPGDPRPRTVPRLFDLEERREIPVDAAPFEEAWSVSSAHWAPDSSRVYVRYDRRGHQLQRIYAIDADTGEVSVVLEERSETFIDYSQKTRMRWLDGTNELLWTSERDGWNHLYLLDLKTLELRQVTRGEFVVHDIDRIDEARREVLLAVKGLRPGEDPYHRHLARVHLDTGELTLLTEADATQQWTHVIGSDLFIARWSRVDHPEVTELRRMSDGALLCELGRDDASALHAEGFTPPQRFVAKGRDGVTDIHGILIRPSNFDPKRKYPVIEAIYAGPHDFHVPKEFELGLRERKIAELGFIVVQIDGMGTNWRSKAFHDVCWKNIADAGFPDRIAWMRAAAEAHPELDLERVGIFGGSAGGQNALGALLFHNDFYDVAVADCGCHDNRLDKMWWNEAWMGWPIGPEYEASSNVVNAHRLEGKLLLTVGELDTNVDPASTLQVVDALIRADKDFEFVLVPGAGHGVGESPYLARRRQDFFVRHLLGVEPRTP